MPHTPLSPRHRANAKSMRKVMTDAERKLWNEIRAHQLMGLGFRRQFPIAGYIVDFACPKRKLVVEVDGSQHAEVNAATDDEVKDEASATGWLDHPALLERRCHSRYRQCLPAHRHRGWSGWHIADPRVGRTSRQRWRDSAPSVLPDISPLGGEIGRRLRFRQSPASQGERCRRGCRSPWKRGERS